MPKKKTRASRRRRASVDKERPTFPFPILIILVLGVILLGLFSYTAMLVAGSAIFAGYFGWRRWKRRST